MPSPCQNRRRLHLADAAVGGIGPHRVAGLRRGRIDVDGAEHVDAARRVNADHARGLLAQLPLDGEAVLNLVGDFGVGLQLRQRRRLRAERDAVGDGHAAGVRAAWPDRARAPATRRARILVAHQVEQRTASRSGRNRCRRRRASRSSTARLSTQAKETRGEKPSRRVARKFCQS